MRVGLDQSIGNQPLDYAQSKLGIVHQRRVKIVTQLRAEIPPPLLHGILERLGIDFLAINLGYRHLVDPFKVGVDPEQGKGNGDNDDDQPGNPALGFLADGKQHCLILSTYLV